MKKTKLYDVFFKANVNVIVSIEAYNEEEAKETIKSAIDDDYLNFIDYVENAEYIGNIDVSDEEIVGCGYLADFDDEDEMVDDAEKDNNTNFLKHTLICYSVHNKSILYANTYDCFKEASLAMNEAIKDVIDVEFDYGVREYDLDVESHKYYGRVENEVGNKCWTWQILVNGEM